MGLITIQVSQDEKNAQALSPLKRARILDAIRSEGIIILEGIFGSDHLGSISAKINEDFESSRNTSIKWIGGGKRIGHLNSKPPCSSKYLSSELLLNPILFDLTDALFEQRTANIKFTCNTNLPGSVRQSFHPDFRDLPDVDQINISVPLCDVSELNGSTEVIPGTHRKPFSFKELDKVLLSRSPVRANASLGSAMIWFPSLWHRGTANYSSEIRNMITLTHAGVGSKSFKLSTGSIFPEAVRTSPLFQTDRIKVAFEEFEGNTRFTPNYFKPTIIGNLREMVHTFSPETNEFIMKCLGK